VGGSAGLTAEQGLGSRAGCPLLGAGAGLPRVARAERGRTAVPPSAPQIDHMDGWRDFTFHPANFPLPEMQVWIGGWLVWGGVGGWWWI
jgi:hypothetical protein